MGSHPTGSDKLLEINTDEVTFVVKSKPLSLSLDLNDKISSLAVSGNNIKTVKICDKETFNNESNDLSSFVIPVIPIFFEQHDYELVVKSNNKKEISVWHENFNIRDRISRVTDEKDLVSGIINFDNNIGFSDFQILIDSKTVLTVKIEVYPSKIDYKTDYQEIMADITDEIYTVAFDFLKKTYQQMKIGNEPDATPAEFYEILNVIFDSFKRAVRKIVEMPHHKLISENTVLPFYKIKKTNRNTEKWILNHPEHMLHTANGDITASKALTIRKRITYDTIENRFAKYIIQSTIKRLNDFQVRYSKINKDKIDENIIRNVDKMKDSLYKILSISFFGEIGNYTDTHSMSLVFEMAPGYRELFKYYLMLKRGLEINGDIFKISMKETAVLYEYWCFIKLVNIMKRKYDLVSADIIKVDNSGITVNLVKGQKSTVRFVNPKTDEKFTLTYNQGEQNTPTVNQKPDNILSLEKNGSDNQYKYVFDAKYRIETNLNEYYPDNKPGPKLDDINTMHRYRDSIVYENTDKNSRFMFEKTMFGAYVLFPYKNEEEYKKHRFYKSINSVNIGGLPFLPGATSLVESFLTELISDSSESAFERTTLPIGIEERLKQTDWKLKDVLIGYTSNKNQYDDCIENKRFYLPKKYIKDASLPIHYIAITTPKNESESTIKYYGTVIRMSVVQGNNTISLTNKYNNNDEYYAFDVKEWIELKNHIRLTKAQNIGFTNLFLLEHADETSELFSIKSEEEYRLLYELKRIFDTKTTVDNKNNEAIIKYNDRMLIWFHEGTISLVDNNGNIKMGFPIYKFRKNPNLILKEIVDETDEYVLKYKKL